VVFAKEAKLCQCAGIRFYSDPQGVNTVQTIASGKEDRTKLAPVIINKRQVYAEYYFNQEAVPLYYLDECISKLSCIIYQIPELWNTCCWLSDALATTFLQQG
jgi:hypothetical protein